MDTLENNMYADLIYNKPIVDKNTSFITRLKSRLEERRYYKNNIRKIIKDLKYNNPSYATLCIFSDFIRILEIVFFYHNDIIPIKGMDGIRLLSDTNISNSDSNKSLLLLLDNEKVVISIDMIEVNNVLDNRMDERVVVHTKHNYGKKAEITIEINNGTVDNFNKHHHNLLYNVNSILRESMAKLFEDYYKLS